MERYYERSAQAGRFLLRIFDNDETEYMNQAQTKESKFWAGGSQEFHRLHRDKNMGKGFAGLMIRFIRRISNFLVAPIIREIDDRLFLNRKKK